MTRTREGKALDLVEQKIKEMKKPDYDINVDREQLKHFKTLVDSVETNENNSSSDHIPRVPNAEEKSPEQHFEGFCCYVKSGFGKKRTSDWTKSRLYTDFMKYSKWVCEKMKSPTCTLENLLEKQQVVLSTQMVH